MRQSTGTAGSSCCACFYVICQADPKVRFNTPSGIPCGHSLPLPLGEVDERSEGGEGHRKSSLSTSSACLSLWARLLSAAKTGKAAMSIAKDTPPEGCKTLSVTCGDSSPRGRAKGLRPLHWRAASHLLPKGKSRTATLAGAIAPAAEERCQGPAVRCIVC